MAYTTFIMSIRTRIYLCFYLYHMREGGGSCRLAKLAEVTKGCECGVE